MQKTTNRPLWLAVASLIITVGAWIVGAFSGIMALILCIMAIVAAAFALKSHKGAVRNTAITSIVAAGVLLVVIAAFMIVIYIGLR